MFQYYSEFPSFTFNILVKIFFSKSVSRNNSFLFKISEIGDDYWRRFSRKCNVKPRLCSLGVQGVFIHFIDEILFTLLEILLRASMVAEGFLNL